MTTNAEPLTIGRKTYIQLDCTAPDNVEVIFDRDGKRIWVNAEGICLLRICRAKAIEVFDNRTPELCNGIVQLSKS